VLALIRHGECEGNAAGLVVGRTDSPLTERGLGQARTLGKALRATIGPVVRIVSSPLSRARGTAQALDLGARVEIDERWIEIDHGELDGTHVDSVPEDVWDRWRREPAWRPEGGESLLELGARIREACDELAAEVVSGSISDDGKPGTVVVVSHVSPIKAAVAWAVGGGDELAWRMHLSVASLTRVRLGGPVPVLLTFNETPHC
jgi:probable phosphoglycerate mutase